MTTLRHHNPSDVAAPLGAYSHAVIVPAGTELLALAGQVGIAPDGSVPAEAEAQYELALQNIVRILASQGATPADVIKLNTYAVPRMDLAQVGRMRVRVLGDIKPASTFVYVAGLARDDLLVEVEAWAICHR